MYRRLYFETLDSDGDDINIAPLPSTPAAPLIESDSQPLIRTRHIRHAGSARDIRLALPNLLVLPVDSVLVWACGPVAHCAPQGFGAVWLVNDGTGRSSGEDIVCEAAGAGVAGFGGSDCGGTVVALLEADVAMCAVIIGGRELELDPGGRQLGPSLDAAFEGII